MFEYIKLYFTTFKERNLLVFLEFFGIELQFYVFQLIMLQNRLISWFQFFHFQNSPTVYECSHTPRVLAHVR